MFWIEEGDIEPLPVGDEASEANFENGFNSEGGVVIGVIARDLQGLIHCIEIIKELTFKSSTMLLRGAGVLPIDRDEACLNAGGRPPKSCVAAVVPTSRA